MIFRERINLCNEFNILLFADGLKVRNRDKLSRTVSLKNIKAYNFAKKFFHTCKSSSLSGADMDVKLLFYLVKELECKMKVIFINNKLNDNRSSSISDIDTTVKRRRKNDVFPVGMRSLRSLALNFKYDAKYSTSV